MNSYEEKRAARIERALDRARNARLQSESFYRQSEESAKVIPMGQPILVGHHSEKRHRRHIAQINAKMRNSIEASKKADYYESKAQSIENNTAISSDDPEALTKLKVKLIALQSIQDKFKEINKLIRSKKTNEEKKNLLTAVYGLKEATADEFLKYSGVPSYKLSNNSANMRTVKKRIEELEKRAMQATKTTDLTHRNIKIVDSVEENRLQIFFEGKPAEEIRKHLKHNGFRWSPRNNCWQAFRNEYKRKEIIKFFE